MKIFNDIKMMFGIGSALLISSCAVLKNDAKSYNTIALEQAEQDSAFYRNIFNQSLLAQDSTAINEFNKIAAQMKSINSLSRNDLSAEILKNGEENGINKDQSNVIKGVQYISNKQAIRTKQQLADKYVFENFFKKYGKNF